MPTAPHCPLYSHINIYKNDSDYVFRLFAVSTFFNSRSTIVIIKQQIALAVGFDESAIDQMRSLDPLEAATVCAARAGGEAALKVIALTSAV